MRTPRLQKFGTYIVNSKQQNGDRKRRIQWETEPWNWAQILAAAMCIFVQAIFVHCGHFGTKH